MAVAVTRWRATTRVHHALGWACVALGFAAGLLVHGQDVPAAAIAAREQPPEPGPDFTLDVRQGVAGRLRVEATHAGPAQLLLVGLQRGGAVSILVNGSPPQHVELQARQGSPVPVQPTTVTDPSRAALGPQPGRADSAIISTVLKSGDNVVEVDEAEGIQAVHVWGTGRWFVGSTLSAGNALFWIDLDLLSRPTSSLPARVFYGPDWGTFLWFSPAWSGRRGDASGDRVSAVLGSCGAAAAAFSYTVRDEQLGVVMPTQMTFEPDPLTGAFVIHVQQTLCTDTRPGDGDRLGFLRLRLTEDGARDWGDGAVDYSWYRIQSGTSADAAPGSHTGIVRIADRARWQPQNDVHATASAATARKDQRRVVAALPLAATNTVGGIFSKSGVGSCGWVLHRSIDDLGNEMALLYNRDGPGTGTLFQVSPADGSVPAALAAGRAITAEYSLAMLPCDVTREEIEDLNEADLHFFGTAQEQTATITGWYGTKHAIGLRRSDGSLIILGLGREPARTPLPPGTAKRAVNAYRLFDVVRPTYDYLDLGGDTVEVRPGWVTVIDCGAALWEPMTTMNSLRYTPGGWPEVDGQAGQTEANRYPWPQPPTGGPFEGLLMRK